MTTSDRFGAFLHGVPAATARALEELRRRVSQREPSEWGTPSFGTSWGSFGSGFQAVEYRKVGDLVEVRGLALKNATFAAADTVFTLPVGCRPAGQIVLAVRANTNAGEIAGRVDITTGGACITGFASSSASGNWVSFHHSFSTLT